MTNHSDGPDLVPVIAIGGSAGGVEALCTLVAGLPADFPAALLAVCHISPRAESHLAAVVAREARIRVKQAQGGERIQRGCLYVAVPDRHLLLEDNCLRLTRGPKENRNRPAIDALFRSCAYYRGERAIGVVLSGLLDDGTAGLWAIKDRGGIALVQDPNEAEYPAMPASALQQLQVDAVARLDEFPALLLNSLQDISGRSVTPSRSPWLKIETRIAAGENAIEAGAMELGPASNLTCPDCSGTMVEITDGATLRYRCHTGHAYSALSLQDGVDLKIDDLLWKTLRAIEERMLLLGQRAKAARLDGDHKRFAQYEVQIEDARQRAASIRELLSSEDALGHTPEFRT